jgi:hypothetical protein
VYPQKWRWQQRVGSRLVVYYTRPRSYDSERYLNEWEQVAVAVRAVDPRLPLAGTDGLGVLVSPVQFISRERARLAIYTQHYYAASSCDAGGRPYRPQDPRYMTLARLLGESGTTKLTSVVAASGAARAYKVPLYIDETNSIACGGSAEVTAGFGAALWALDQFFTDVLLGAQGVDLHIDDVHEAPFRFYYDAVDRRWSAPVWPLYYAMLAFAQAAGSHGLLLGSATLAARPARNANVHLFAVRQPDGSLRVLVINKSLQVSGLVRLTIPGANRSARLTRLRAPAPSSMGGVTLAGQSIAGVSSDGRLRGSFRAESVRPSDGIYTFSLPRASAATLFVPRPGG